MILGDLNNYQYSLTSIVCGCLIILFAPLWIPIWVWFKLWEGINA